MSALVLLPWKNELEPAPRDAHGDVLIVPAKPLDLHRMGDARAAPDDVIETCALVRKVWRRRETGAWWEVSVYAEPSRHDEVAALLNARG